MIALRRKLQRAAQHPLLGPVVLLLLALLLVFTALHATHDQMHSDDLIVCVAFVLLALSSLLRKPPSIFRSIVQLESRGPPNPATPAAVSARLGTPRPPLRL